MVVTSDIEDKDHYDEEGRERGMGDLRRENANSKRKKRNSFFITT